MLFSLRVFFEDYNREEASTGISINGVGSTPELDAIMLSFASVIEGLSDARIVKGEARTKFAPTTPQVVKGLSSSYDRLIVLCTNGTEYGSITIPAPRSFVYAASGPFSGFLLDKTVQQNIDAIQPLLNALANTVTPTGVPFPVADWKAALMVNQ